MDYSLSPSSFFKNLKRNCLYQIEKYILPLALVEYLIKTYSKENETVLDFVFGSCTTGLAAKNLNRKFIGIEKDQHYFEIGKKKLME